MRYLDDLTNVAYFKTGQDGWKVFFPWGVRGRGYIIDSEQDFKQLHRQIKIYLAVCCVLMLGPALVLVQLPNLGFLSFVSAAFLLVGYLTVICTFLLLVFALWVRYRVRRMRPSEERLSRQDVISHARAIAAMEDKAFPGTGWLWLMEIVALVFVCLGFFILLAGTGDKLVALATIVLFGLGAAGIAVRLLVRRRLSTTNS
jgi:hypothetical protein